VVTVRYWAGARAAAGCTEEVVDAGTVGDLVAAIGRRPPLARVLSASSLLVDGSAVHRDDVEHPLRGDAVVDVLPPFAGG
jgi:molybdopterin synthase sulfur carrier subunit